MGKFGGAQPNAGRKPGSLNKKTIMLRNVAKNALKRGETPLDVMLANMRYHHSKAEELLTKVLEDCKGGKKLNPKHIEMLYKLNAFRSESQKAAADAAPYVHAKYATITMKGEVKLREELKPGTSLEKAMELYEANMRSFPHDVRALAIEHDNTPQDATD